jgi:hypothetical protein
MLEGSRTLTADQVDGSAKKWLRKMRRNVDPNGWPVRTPRHPRQMRVDNETTITNTLEAKGLEFGLDRLSRSRNRGFAACCAPVKRAWGAARDGR